MKISCSICQYGEIHDYLDRYYCRNKECYRSKIFDQPETFDCDYGKLRENLRETKTMISANEARQQAENNNNNAVIEELNKLDKQIEQAVIKGCFDISYDGYLQRETIAELQRLGYNVRYGTTFNDALYIISWR